LVSVTSGVLVLVLVLVLACVRAPGG